jgi:hypothetical protein
VTNYRVQGLSTDLAAELGVDVWTLRRWEQGKETIHALKPAAQEFGEFDGRRRLDDFLSRDGMYAVRILGEVSVASLSV